MDQIVTTLIGAAPQLGVGGVLVILIGILIRREAQDATRHAEELKRINVSHDEELAELRQEIRDLRGEVRTLNQKLDEERDRRRRAEDSTSQLGRHRGEPPWQT